jgi:hypothetical protein
MSHAFGDSFRDSYRGASDRAILMGRVHPASQFEIIGNSLVRVEGEPDAPIRHVAVVGVGSKALQTLLETHGLTDNTDLCPVAYRQEGDHDPEITVIYAGFGEGHAVMREQAAQQGLEGEPLATAFWVGDVAFRAGMGLGDLEARRIYLIDGPAVLDRTEHTYIGVGIPFVDGIRD